ncbi:MAG: serine hydrolase domain-containing protein [Phycisphaerae bacterium]
MRHTPSRLGAAYRSGRFRRLSACLCGLSLLALAGAQTSASKPVSDERVAYEAAVTELLQTTVAAGESPAIGAAIIRDGKLVGVSVAGVRKAGSPEPVTVDDLWHIGSCAKAMTATVLAMLVEEDKLKWESTLADVFPELKDAMHADFRSVTLDQLLAHRGGIDDSKRLDLWGKMRQGGGSLTEKRLAVLRDVTAGEPHFAPGSKMMYCNLGYTIAGAMAERVTKTDWETLIRKRLFEPLGMTSVGFGTPGERNSVVQPMGHMEGGKKPIAVLPGPLGDNPPALAPAGTMHMSLGDWARFVSMHLDGAAGRKTLLKPESFKHMHTPRFGDEDAACGWIKLQRPWGGNVLTHGGSNTYWYCTVWAAPEKGFAVLVTTNRGGDEYADTLDRIVSSLILDLTGEKPLPR